jgi:hypothetical protein
MRINLDIVYGLRCFLMISRRVPPVLAVEGRLGVGRTTTRALISCLGVPGRFGTLAMVPGPSALRRIRDAPRTAKIAPPFARFSLVQGSTIRASAHHYHFRRSRVPPAVAWRSALALIAGSLPWGGQSLSEFWRSSNIAVGSVVGRLFPTYAMTAITGLLARQSSSGWAPFYVFSRESRLGVSD